MLSSVAGIGALGNLLVIGACGPVGVGVILALIAGLAIPQTRWRGKLGLVLLCLAPTLVLTTIMFLMAPSQPRINLPEARFQNYLANPVPASVSNLKFVPDNERQGCSDLLLRFNIAKADLDRIIAENFFSMVTPGTLRSLNDRFSDPQFLRIGDSDELYQAEFRRGWGVSTLRVNKEHTSAVLRRENGWSVEHLQTRNPQATQPTTAPTTTRPIEE